VLQAREDLAATRQRRSGASAGPSDVAYADEVAAQREVDLILEQSSLANALRCLLHGVVSLNTREMLIFLFSFSI